jgi:hypothetical protein
MATERLASAMRPLPTSSFGYPVREPVPSEQAFFALNPNVGGYAAEDGAIVLNEGARSGDRYLSNRELGGVARNEASRLYMRDRSIVPDFSLTKDQELEFQGTAYGSNPEALKQSIAARIITGDQSAGETTKEQGVVRVRVPLAVPPSVPLSRLGPAYGSACLAPPSRPLCPAPCMIADSLVQ